MSNPNTFTIYNASAGSGKTYTLVKEYLKLLLNAPGTESYKNILAITFTNKAVGEMKTRIVESLDMLSQEKPSQKAKDLLSKLAEETGLKPGEIRDKSRGILKSIIHNYAAFEVSTIDGFTHRVLRTFAKDLDLPLNFEVELQTEEVLNEAVERLISKAGEDKELTRVLVEFVLTKTDDDKSWDISRDLFNIARLLTQETNQPFLDLLKNKSFKDFEKLRKDVEAQQKASEAEVIAHANSFFELLIDNGIENKDFSGGYCPKFFEKLQKKNFEVGFDAKWQTSLADEPLYAKKLLATKKEILDRLQPQISDIYQAAKQNLINHQFLQAVQRNLVPLSLLSAIQKEIETLKKENSVVLISEFNATIGKAVKDQPAPFIYERLGEQYRHYFIDEFQDTSQLQWENLIPLVDHTLTIEHPSPQNGSLTLVGDAKQSIYRWRGGKAEQFMELCNGKNPFNLEEKKVVMLPKNYRSARTVVDFNNDFFKFSASCFEHEGHKELFEKSSQEPVAGQKGYVNISFIEAENAAEEMEAYPARVLEIIRKLEAQKFKKNSICILTRRRKESIAVADFLSQHSVAVISAESLLLSRSPQVCFINAVLRFCIEYRDKNLKFEILDFLLDEHLQVENEFLFLKHGLEPDGQDFFDLFKPYGIGIDLETVNSLSVYEAAEYIIRAFNLQEEANAYLQYFLDFVYEVSNSEGAGIFEYLELWERKKEGLSIVVPEGEDAVQIMTIHKAKGLEFPVVIYPFANTQINDVARESFWMELPDDLKSQIGVAYLKASEKMKNWSGEAPALYEDLCSNSRLDALNVLYVAMTRPEQQLYVISKLELDKNENENMNKFSGLFISYLRSLGKWDGSLEYEFGDFAEKPEEGHQEVTESLRQSSFFSSPTESNGVAIISRAGLLWDSKQKAAIEKGQLIHDLFAQINTKADIAQVLLNAREEGLFKDAEEEEIRRTIVEVVEHQDLKDFFSGEMINYNERDIISASGELLRPDRLIFDQEEVSIIDYKTGAENAKHREQINSYAQVLENMNHRVKQKLLVYINEEIKISVV